MMFRLRKLSLPFSTGGPEENSELLVSGEFILLGKLHHSKYGDDDVQLGNLFPYLCLWHRK